MRSARLEVVSEGILEEERFKPGLEGGIELKEVWGEHPQKRMHKLCRSLFQETSCLIRVSCVCVISELVCVGREKQSIRSNSEG